MQNDNKDVVQDVTKVNYPAPLTNEQLLKMVLDGQRETANAYKALGEAILESRKPYESPSAKASREQNLAERRKQIEMQLRIKEQTKLQCPHKREDGRLNIKWMEHSNGVTLGVCGECTSQFDTRNPADLALLRADPKSIRNMGRAGAHARRGAGGSVPLTTV